MSATAIANEIHAWALKSPESAAVLLSDLRRQADMVFIRPITAEEWLRKCAREGRA